MFQTTITALFAHRKQCHRLPPMPVAMQRDHIERAKMHEKYFQFEWIFVSPSSSNWLLYLWLLPPRSHLSDAAILQKMSTPACSISPSMRCILISAASSGQARENERGREGDNLSESDVPASSGNRWVRQYCTQFNVDAASWSAGHSSSISSTYEMHLPKKLAAEAHTPAKIAKCGRPIVQSHLPSNTLKNNNNKSYTTHV